MKIGTKQVALLVIAITLIAVGYLHTDIINFFKGNTSIQGNTPVNSDGVSGEGDDVTNVNGPASLVFSSNRLERDTARGKTKETYEEITKDSNAAEAVKTEAYEKIIQLTQRAENETKIEGLIREKGFEDAFLSYNDIGELDILVKTSELNEEQVVGITDIVIRYTDLDYKDIHIRKVA